MLTVAEASSTNVAPVVTVRVQCWFTISSLLNGDIIQAPELVLDAVVDVVNTIHPVFSDVLVDGSSTGSARFALAFSRVLVS